MPRNSGGTYSLPAGNPVVTATAISTTWANDTLNDLKAEMTDSLSRSGKGAMSAVLQIIDGTSGVPALAFASDLDTGLYGGAGILKFVCGGTDVLWLSASTARLGGTAPALQFEETDAAANNKLWDFLVTGEALKFRAMTDALAATDWCVVERTGNTIDSITISATSITLNGYTPTITGGLAALNAANVFTNTNEFQSTVLISGTAPLERYYESDGAANNRYWQWKVNGEQFLGQTINDALASTANWIVVDRTGTVVDLVNFPGTAVTITGTLGVTGTSTLGAVNAGVMTGTSFAGAVAATTLSASSTVSGAGFSTYLASPPAIGTTAPAGGRFTFAHTAPVTVTFNATTMTADCSLSNVFATTFTANVTVAPTISNAKDGQTINWYITQDATGSRTMTWPTSFKWKGATAGVLTTSANAVDLLVASYRSATGFWVCDLNKDYR